MIKPVLFVFTAISFGALMITLSILPLNYCHCDGYTFIEIIKTWKFLWFVLSVFLLSLNLVVFTLIMEKLKEWLL